MATVLNVREKPEGGGFLPRVDAEPSIVRAATVIVLVHGFNNSRREAAEQYDAIGRSLPAIEAAGQLCAFFWPGDKSWGPVSSLGYSMEIAPARKAGALLADFLAGVTPPGPWPLRVVLVCHSLGCRVGLEAIARSMSLRSPVEFDACLMAAAVPAGFVDADGRLRPGAEAARRTLVLFSTADRVLGVAFRIGEAFAFEGWFPEAVGWAGAPAGFWGPAAVSMTGYRHNDYWRGREAASRLAGLLGLAFARETGRRGLPVGQVDRAGRIPAANLGARRVPEFARHLPVRG
jgi:hypothetical protein